MLCMLCIAAGDQHPLTDAVVFLLGVVLKVVLDAGLKKSQFGFEPLRLGEQQVLVPC